MDQPNNVTPLPTPDVSLGWLQFELNLDTSDFRILWSNPHTAQLFQAIETQNMFPLYAWRMFCEEAKRRSKKVIVT
jgi:hypothetical protein